LSVFTTVIAIAALIGVAVAFGVAAVQRQAASGICVTPVLLVLALLWWSFGRVGVFYSDRGIRVVRFPFDGRTFAWSDVASIAIAPGSYRRMDSADYRASLWLLPHDGAWIETPLTEGVMLGEMPTPRWQVRVFLSRERLAEVMETLREAGAAQGADVFTQG
jgi:hypothetical protein